MRRTKSKRIKSSRTAPLIAESLYLLSRQRRFASLFPPRSNEFLSLFAQERKRRRPEIIAAARSALLNLAIPGITLHYLLRKKRIEQIARRAIAADYSQIVVLGTGFDALSVRLGQEFPAVSFFEIDRFANQLKKVRRLSERGVPFPNVSFFAGDLSVLKLEEILNSALFDECAKTLYIAEGLLMYLSPDKVSELFASIRELGGENLFAFTFMDKSAGGKIRFKNSSKTVDFWLAHYGEPFKWGVFADDLPAFLDELGFASIFSENAADFRRMFLENDELRHETLAEGESLCLARVKK